LLTKAFPIDVNHRHNLTVNNNGLLTITIWLPFHGGFAAQPFTLNDADLEKPLEQIVEETMNCAPKLL